MGFEIALTPANRLRLQQSNNDSVVPIDAWMKSVASAFASSQAEGLFVLAAARPEGPPPLSFSFWRDLGCRYLTELCRTPESTGDRLDPIETPAESELGAMLLSAPPMQGGEYLSIEVLADACPHVGRLADGEAADETTGSGKIEWFMIKVAIPPK